MSDRTPHPSDDSLQHAAEHERPPKRNPVILYLLILFAAAFLLLLMSFFMQQRTNQEAMDHLEETSNSAVESLENKLKENETLKQQVSQLEEEKEQLTAQAAQQATQTQQQLGDLEAMLQALTDLNTVRSLYNQGRYSDARDYLAQLETATDGTYMTEALLNKYVQEYTDPTALEIYNPLEAWQQLTRWLG